MGAKVRKGELIYADTINNIIDDVLNRTPNAGSDTILTSGVGGFSVSTSPKTEPRVEDFFEGAFYLTFIESADGSKLEALVNATFIIDDQTTIIPKLDGVKICEESIDPDFEPPKKDVTPVGDYEMWVEYTGDNVNIHINLEADSPEKTDSSTWLKYAKWTVTADKLVDDFIPYKKKGEATHTSSVCDLGQMNLEPKDTPESPDLYTIRSGYLYSGGSSFFLEKEGLAPVEDHKVYVKINITIDEIDGVLTNVYTTNTATIETGATVPDNHDFVAGSATGDFYYELGFWENIAQQGEDPQLAFRRAGCGSIHTAVCSNGSSAVINSVRGD